MSDLFKYNIGEKTTIEDVDFFGYKMIDVPNFGTAKTPIKQEVIVTEKEINFDNPQSSKIIIKTYRDEFEDLFEKISATTTQLQFNEGAYNRAASIVNADGSINVENLQTAFANNEIILSKSSNQNVIISNEGIEVGNADNSSERVRIVSGGIMISSDGGRTWMSAITGAGINTKYLLAGTIDTQKINITNGVIPIFRWDKEGIAAYRTNSLLNSYDANAYVKFNQYGIYATTNGDELQLLIDGATTFDDKLKVIKENSNFSLTWDGMYLRGADGGGVSLTASRGLQVFGQYHFQQIFIDSGYPYIYTPDGVAYVGAPPNTQDNLIPLVELGKFIDGDPAYTTPHYGIRFRNATGAVTLMQDVDDGSIIFLNNQGEVTIRQNNEGNLWVRNLLQVGNPIAWYLSDDPDHNYPQYNFLGIDGTINTTEERKIILYSGDYNKETAPFKVYDNGDVFINNAEITGVIYANSGNLNNINIGPYVTLGRYYAAEFGSFSNIYFNADISSIPVPNMPYNLVSFLVNRDSFENLSNQGISSLPLLIDGASLEFVDYTQYDSFILELVSYTEDEEEGIIIELQFKDYSLMITDGSYDFICNKQEPSTTITYDGILTCKNAIIEGTGTFSGIINAESGVFNGYIYAKGGSIEEKLFFGNSSYIGANLTDLYILNLEEKLLVDKYGRIFLNSIYLGENINWSNYILINGGYTKRNVYNIVVSNNENDDYLVCYDPSTIIPQETKVFSITSSGNVFIKGTLETEGNVTFKGSLVSINNKLIIDGDNGYITSGNPPYDGWGIYEDGTAFFNNVTVSGTLNTVVFNENTISGVSGDLFISPSFVLLNNLVYDSLVGEFFDLELAQDINLTLWAPIKQVTIVIDNTTYENIVVNNMKIVHDSNLPIDTLPIGTKIIATDTNSNYILLKSNYAAGVYMSMNSPSGRIVIGVLDSNTLPTNYESLLGTTIYNEYGIYADNVYLTGMFVLPNAGVISYNNKFFYMNDIIDGNQIRFWAGSDLIHSVTDANFVVTQNGNLYARNGVFHGTVVSENSIVSGNLSIVGIIIDNDGITPEQGGDFYEHFYITKPFEPEYIEPNPLTYIINMDYEGLSIWNGFHIYSDYYTGFRKGVFGFHISEINFVENFDITLEKHLNVRRFKETDKMSINDFSGQTAPFTINNIDPSNNFQFEIYLNGLRLSPSQYTSSISGTTLTVTPLISIDSSFKIFIITYNDPFREVLDLTSQITVSTLAFNFPSSFLPTDNLSIFLNGQLLIQNIDYTFDWSSYRILFTSAVQLLLDNTLFFIKQSNSILKYDYTGNIKLSYQRDNAYLDNFLLYYCGLLLGKEYDYTVYEEDTYNIDPYYGYELNKITYPVFEFIDNYLLDGKIPHFTFTDAHLFKKTDPLNFNNIILQEDGIIFGKFNMSSEIIDYYLLEDYLYENIDTNFTFKIGNYDNDLLNIHQPGILINNQTLIIGNIYTKTIEIESRGSYDEDTQEIKNLSETKFHNYVNFEDKIQIRPNNNGISFYFIGG